MSEWINVKDQLPCPEYDGKAVLVAVVNHKGSVISETDAWVEYPSLGEGRFDFWGSSVTHWMPLPEPPK